MRFPIIAFTQDPFVSIHRRRCRNMDQAVGGRILLAGLRNERSTNMLAMKQITPWEEF